MKLTNKEVILANNSFQRLLAVKFPVRTGMLLVKASATLDKHVETIEKMRKQLVEKHALRDEKDKAKPIEPGTPEMEAFVKDWLELLDMEEDMPEITLVKLPEKIAATCDKCHHNMDKTFEIEPEILKGLVKFVE